MTNGIMDMILQECQERHVYKSEIYAPFYVSSYACHVFNIWNQRKRFYWENKSVPNMRIHLLFIAPPGFMKTFYLDTFAGPENSIFGDSRIDITFKQSMTEAAFTGTCTNGSETMGIAKAHKEGIIAVDEFSALMNAMKSQYNNQFESQLLAALDHGNIQKDLGTWGDSYKTMFTLWGGIQPSRFDMTAGLGRRFCYLLFIPDEEDNTNLRNMKSKIRGLRADPFARKHMNDAIHAFNEGIMKIETLTFDDSIDALYEKRNLFNYETSFFDRLALGYNLAKYGPEKNMVITADDKDLVALIDREKKWRTTLQKGVDYSMIAKVMEKHEGKIHQSVLIDECLIYGWNAAQVMDILKGMRNDGLIRGRNKLLELT